MTVSTASHPIRKAPLFTPYVVMWSMLGALSLGFLMILGLAPEWLDDLKPASVIADPQSNHGQRAAARMASDLGQLKDSVAQIQLDLSKVKTDVELQGAQQKTVSEQVASLETRISAALPAAALEATAPAPLQTAPSSGASAGAANGGVSDAVKGPAKTIKVINADTTSAGAALETGSVSGQVAQMKTAKPAVQEKATADEQAFDTAIVKPAKQPLGVKVSTGASVDSLRLIWSLLNDRHGDALQKLEPRYTAAGDAMNPTYDLVAGPIPTKADAQKICQTLTGRGLSCSIRDFSGRQL